MLFPSVLVMAMEAVSCNAAFQEPVAASAALQLLTCATIRGGTWLRKCFSPSCNFQEASRSPGSGSASKHSAFCQFSRVLYMQRPVMAGNLRC